MATVSTRAPLATWHELVAGDVRPEQAFYAELFGWSIAMGEPGGADYPTAEVDGRPQAGFLRLQGRRPHWLTYVRVSDVDRVAARASEQGGRVYAAPEEIAGVGRYTVFADPQGALVAASLPEEPSLPPHASVFVWDELMTTDVAGAKRFYAAIFGWSVAPSFPGYAVFRSEGRDVAGVLAKPPEVPVPVWLPYVRVGNADESTRRARALGAHLVAGPHELEDVGRWSVLLDPGGAVFGLVEPAR